MDLNVIGKAGSMGIRLVGVKTESILYQVTYAIPVLISIRPCQTGVKQIVRYEMNN